MGLRAGSNRLVPSDPDVVGIRSLTEALPRFGSLRMTFTRLRHEFPRIVKRGLVVARKGRKIDSDVQSEENAE